MLPSPRPEPGGSWAGERCLRTAQLCWGGRNVGQESRTRSLLLLQRLGSTAHKMPARLLVKEAPVRLRCPHPPSFVCPCSLQVPNPGASPMPMEFPVPALSLVCPLLWGWIRGLWGETSGVSPSGSLPVPPSSSPQDGAGPVPQPSSLQTQHRLLPKSLHKIQQDFLTGWFGPWQRGWSLDPRWVSMWTGSWAAGQGIKMN